MSTNFNVMELIRQLGEDLQTHGHGQTDPLESLFGQPSPTPAPAPPVMPGAGGAASPGGLRVGSPEWAKLYPRAAEHLTPPDPAHGIGPEDLEFERRAQYEGDKNARKQVLAGGFKPTSDPWNSVDQGAAQMLIDMGAHDLLNAKDAQAREAIDRSADDSGKRTLEAHQMSAAIEALMPTERPTMSTDKVQGAFDQSPDGTYTNAPPQMRLGQARDVQQGAIVRESMLAIQQGLSGLEARLADEVKKGVRSQQDADDTYNRAERRAGMLMQGIMQGKSDFSGFFKKGSGLEDLLAAASAAQPQQPSR